MMADYAHFGDVVCFDTTYRNNKDCLPFAMFVGVNHHEQTTVFGIALLYDKFADEFFYVIVWYFFQGYGWKDNQNYTYRSKCSNGKSISCLVTSNNSPLVYLAHLPKCGIKTKWCICDIQWFFKRFQWHIWLWRRRWIYQCLEQWIFERYNIQDNDWLKWMYT